MSAASPPALTYLATFTVRVADPIEVGPTAEGQRRIVPILGGTVDGPELRGTILPAGADHQVIRTPTLTELRAEYAIETEEGERILVANSGVRVASAADSAAIARGEAVDPSRVYFRTAPRLTSTGERWAWLAERILVASGERYPGELRLDIFIVE